MKTVLAVAAIAATLGFASQTTAQTAVERGKYLVESVVGCGNCHTPQGPNGPIRGKTLAGGLEFDHPGFFKAYSTNITPDRETGAQPQRPREGCSLARPRSRPSSRLLECSPGLRLAPRLRCRQSSRDE